MTVLLIGIDHGHEFELLRNEIENLGSDVLLVDVEDWPSEKPLTQNVAEESISVGTETVPIEEIEGAFVKPNTLFIPTIEDKLHGSVSNDENPYAALTQIREYRGMLQSILLSLEHRGATVAPRVESFVWEETNPYGCDLLDSIGIDVPETLATNDSEAAKQFLDSHGKVVYKPIAGIGGAHVLTGDDRDELENLTTPVLFQELVPGDDVRAYVVDDEFVGAFRYTHDEESFSFKLSDGEIGAEAVELPESAREDVLRAVEASPTNYSAVDLRLQEDESYSLLEVNAGGRFMLADSTGITNVAGALATYLTA